MKFRHVYAQIVIAALSVPVLASGCSGSLQVAAVDDAPAGAVDSSPAIAFGADSGAPETMIVRQTDPQDVSVLWPLDEHETKLSAAFGARWAGSYMDGSGPTNQIAVLLVSPGLSDWKALQSITGLEPARLRIHRAAFNLSELQHFADEVGRVVPPDSLYGIDVEPNAVGVTFGVEGATHTTDQLSDAGRRKADELLALLGSDVPPGAIRFSESSRSEETPATI